MKQEDKRCRICGEKEEKVEHVLYECVETRSIRQNLFDEEGKKLEQMKEIAESRKQKRCRETKGKRRQGRKTSRHKEDRYKERNKIKGQCKKENKD